MDMRCYRKILRISHKDRVTNEENRAKIQQTVGPHENLLTIVKRRKLKWYGHISRSSAHAKTFLQGTLIDRGKKTSRADGRSGKTTSGKGHAWRFVKFLRAVENRENGENWL